MIPEKGPKRNPGPAIRKRVTNLEKRHYITSVGRSPGPFPCLALYL